MTAVPEPMFANVCNLPVGVVQILVFQAYWISFYLHFIAVDFMYVAEFL